MISVPALSPLWGDPTWQVDPAEQDPRSEGLDRQRQAQTTRTQVRGVLTSDTHQIVFVDTPGIHKPRSAGTSLNATAADALSDVDIVCFVVDATAPYGRGDAFIAESLPKDAIVVVTKADIAKPEQVLEQLSVTSQLEADAWFPVSGRTGDGVEALVEHLRARLPLGPKFYPDDMVTDVPDPFWVAELVREQLLAVARQELPLDRHPSDGVGVASDPLRDPGRA